MSFRAASAQPSRVVPMGGNAGLLQTAKGRDGSVHPIEEGTRRRRKPVTSQMGRDEIREENDCIC